MASPYTQDKRIASFSTPLGKDVLVLRKFHGTEGMNELFEFRVEAVTTERHLNFDRAVGDHCTLSARTAAGGARYFNGMLTEVQLLNEEDEGIVYRLVLRPWLWLLSKTRDSLIFHNKTAPDIISEVFKKHRFADYENHLSGDYPELEYCVQYRESDMDFVRRLMEQHGIGFYFRHKNGGHTLVMSDGTPAYQPVPGEKRPFIAVEKYHQREGEHFYQWATERRFTTGQVTLNDYDFKRPNAHLKAEHSADAASKNAKLEIYDYPGKYVERGHGADYARWQLEAARAADGLFEALGDCLSCGPGSLVTLSGHPDKVQNRRYLAVRCSHAFVAEAYRSRKQLEEQSYRGAYTFMDASRPYAPEAVTPKPYIRGPQTAVVVGDGEIDCDKYGRIKVRFHWDRKNDQSVRVRVAQVWASSGWGGIFIPRVGMEVIINFLEGDPDRPIVVGCVYNDDNMPPYDLPGEKNVAGWKSESTKGGGGYNEIAMDDTKGNELLRAHAQRDAETMVENDERREVKNNRKTDIGVNDTLNVGNELYIEANSKITLKVGESTLVIDPVSITLKSVNITASAQANLETSSKALAKHTADATMTIRGAMIFIN